MSVHMQIEAARAEQAALEEQAEAMETENAEMEYALENSGEDDVIAGIARDKLGLTFPDEQIYSDG
ncbi:MAG: septum formation initiator family protein [Oscillospiraceae bacterium]|nr:septum formation initiator family protein [Oscillospiraceae bacterium]